MSRKFNCSNIFWKNLWEFYASPIFFGQTIFDSFWVHPRLAYVVPSWSSPRIEFHYKEKFRENLLFWETKIFNCLATIQSFTIFSVYFWGYLWKTSTLAFCHLLHIVKRYKKLFFFVLSNSFNCLNRFFCDCGIFLTSKIVVLKNSLCHLTLVCLIIVTFGDLSDWIEEVFVFIHAYLYLENKCLEMTAFFKKK